MSHKKRVLILCTGNSARSQMAEGLLRQESEEAFEIESAGIAPSFVRPEAIQAMHEIGIDITSHRSKPIDEFKDREFDYVITVCDNANESCPIFPGAPQRIHWSIEDPAAVEGETRMAAFRKARNDLRARLKEFTQAHATPKPNKQKMI